MNKKYIFSSISENYRKCKGSSGYKNRCYYQYHSTRMMYLVYMVMDPNFTQILYMSCCLCLNLDPQFTKFRESFRSFKKIHPSTYHLTDPINKHLRSC